MQRRKSTVLSFQCTDMMSDAIVTILTGYAAIGLGFAVLFVAVGIERVDHQAKGSGVGFRLIILPGVTALWPLLLSRWIRRVSEPPVERNAHRARARHGDAA
jgi:hypothetical protein